MIALEAIFGLAGCRHHVVSQGHLLTSMAASPLWHNQILFTIQLCRRCLRSLAMDNLRPLRCNHILEVLAITSEV